MSVLVFYDPLSDLASKRIRYGNIDVVGGNRKGFDQDGLDQQAGGHLALGQSGLEIVVQGSEELTSKGHIGGDAQVVGTGGEALHVLELHAGKLGKLLRLVWQQGAEGDVIVVSFLLALDYNGIDAAVGIFVAGAGEVWELGC